MRAPDGAMEWMGRPSGAAGARGQNPAGALEMSVPDSKLDTENPGSGDDNTQDGAKGRLSLRPGGRMELGKTEQAGSVRQSFSHGRSKTVQVEVVKKRATGPGGAPAAAGAAPRPAGPQAAGPARAGGPPRAGGPARAAGPAPAPGRPLTQGEQANRLRVLEEMRRQEAERQRQEREQQALLVRSANEEAQRRQEEERRAAEEAAERAAEARRRAEEEARRAQAEAPPPAPAPVEARAPEPQAPAPEAPRAPERPVERAPERPAPAAARPAPAPRPAEEAPRAATPREDRGPGGFGTRPAAGGDRGYAQRPAAAPSGDRGYVQRPSANPSGDRGYVQRPAAGPSGDRGYVQRPAAGPSGDRGYVQRPAAGPSGDRGYAQRPAGAPGGDRGYVQRPAGGPGGDRGYAARPAGGPGGDRGYAQRPAGGPGGDRAGYAPRAGGPGGYGAGAPLAARRPGPVPSSLPAGGPKLSLRPRGPGEGPPPGSMEDENRRPPPRRLGGPSPLAARKPVPAPAKKGLTPTDRKREGRIDVQAAIEGDDDRGRSLASVRRARERERRQAELARLRSGQERVVRDVVIPDVITVQELANRMAARAGEVVKALFRMGVMATITQSIDADTAELVATEFGHRVRRVSEADVEQGLEGEADTEEALEPRPPVVTIMGHVDHGKTSLLDALRKTDVAAREAGGITQHIGAYMIQIPSGDRVTFIDTPGHEAFTAMRARGAGVTDMVVLVVAADDGVMPQTIEAIRHARAANVPLIVAVNKIDKQGVNLDRVRQELLQHEVVVESLGGDVQEIQVSATKGTNLDKLLEAIILQAEILDLRANPNRAAEGTVLESKLDKGRGPVATVLVQKGTLNQGDIVVAGAEWGRVRAIIDDMGIPLTGAEPSEPVEILGLSGVPSAGETFVAVEDETRAREITEFRQRKAREKQTAAAGAARGTLNDMLARIQAGEQKEVAVVVKADVQGSAEALGVTLGKLSRDEVRVRVLHSAVGQITESDIQLAKASNAVVVAFNVRATVQARELATRDGVEIRYYSIIYEVADDIEKLVRGKLAPIQREKFLGYAQILQVFEVKRLGNIAGCRVTEGVVKRGAGVRLLRDGVVIHQGTLSTLRRFKDDVKEVANGYECGMSFANYNDIRVDDQIECYETETVAAV
ncbi:translation initiation factor IF-2 [Roseomonas sp. KE2513]|uniref:translation initiation factor IF-2 n=1 Tax=Roseomonas sp. KE2513 TaxID=2479202 RepID=UPI0038CF6BB2